MGTDNRYCQFQDNYLFVGNQKWDLTPLEQGQKPTLVNTFNVPVSNYQYVIGNVVFFGQMESSGTVNTCNIVAHQANPDTTAPTVAGHRPLDGATDCSTIAPIGILIHESLNNETVHAQSVILRKKENQDVISGLITIDDGDILSFVPDTPLEYLTEYEMTLPAGGITDIVGNPISEYRFSFTTGAASGSDTTAPILNSITSTAYPVSVGENVTLSADASDDSGATVQYKWGDGSWGTVSSHSLSFNTEGHHQLELRTRDIYGNVQLHTYLVTVSNNTAMTEDYRSSKIVLDETNRLVWTVNPDNDSVTAIDADTLNVIYEVSVGDQPRYLELVGNEIWVSCKGVNRIDVINTANGLLSGNHPLDYGDAPAGLVYHHSSDKVYLVTQGTGALWKLDATTGAVESSLYLGAEANTVTVSSDGTRALISKFISDGSSGTIWDVDTSNMTLSGTINLSKEMTPDGDSAGRGLPNYITDVSINQARNEAWFSASKANIDRGEFLEGGNGQAPSLAFQNTVRAISGVIDLTTSTEDLALRIDHDNQAFPSGTLFTPLGDYAIVALRGSNSLRVMDTLTGGIAAKQNEIIVELSPDGMVFDPTTNRLFTKNFMSRSVSAHDLGDFLQWGLPITSAGVVNTVTNEVLAADILLGKQIFYNAADVRMSQDGYLSCASCHDDGSMDGMTWDFTERGEGLRNTTSLEGRRGMGHGLVHWSANFDEIQDFEHDIRGPQGGLGFMDNTDFNTGTRNTTLGDSKAGVSPDLDALAAYVTSLDAYPQSPYRNADGSMTAEALAGETHIRSQRCVDCHVGNDFTESKVGTLMDIGTMDASSGNRLGGPLDGIDVPSLRGIWQTPPYLHNGSAATLQEVFDSTHAPAGTAHAKFRDLSQTQQDELIAFLLQLDGDNAEVHSPKLMHGVISNVSSEQWSTIDLGLNYNSPVIIATPIYPDNTQTPILTRIQNVGTTSFELRLDRLDGQSGEILCDVSIVVVEEGVYTTAEDGVKMEAVRFDSSVTAYRNNWVSQARTYQNSYINPVVLGQVMSANDNWSAFWCHGPSIYEKPNSSTLSIGKHVGEDPNNSRLNEEIGYIVIEAGSGEINGIKYYAQVGPDIVRNYTDNGGAPFQYDISAGSLSSVSAAILSISAMDGNDGAWAVLSGALPTPTTMELVADEDILKDNERKHATEEVGYLIFE
jgi:YVTN family beta-propeller protein